MAEAVGRAIDERRHLVVQAGTGTGKSLAYLIPAVLSGERVSWPPPPRPSRTSWPTTTSRRWRWRPGPLPVRRPEGTQQLPVSPAGVRDRGTRRGSWPCSRDRPTLPMPTTPSVRHRESAATRRCPTTPPRSVGSVSRFAAWSAGLTTPPRGTAPTWTSNRTSAPGPWSRPPPASAREPSAAPRDGTASPRRPGPGPPAADVVVVNTHLYATHVASDGAVLPPTRWWCSTRPTKSRT